MIRNHIPGLKVDPIADIAETPWDQQCCLVQNMSTPPSDNYLVARVPRISSPSRLHCQSPQCPAHQRAKTSTRTLSRPAITNVGYFAHFLCKYYIICMSVMFVIILTFIEHQSWHTACNLKT